MLGVLAALADAGALVGEPGTGFLDDAGLHAEIDELAALRDALAVHDVELDHLEGRRHLVLHYLDAGLVADDLLLVLDLADAADVESDRGVEFERVAAGRRLGIAEHDADLHADLVDEDDHGARFGDGAGELPERLAHQARMEAHMAVAHLAFQFLARHQGRDRIDHQHIDRAGAHQRVGDLERLIAGVGLRDEELVDIDAELFRIGGVERVFRIDEGAGAAVLLRLGNDVEGERGLARALGPVNLDDAAARQSSDAERDIEAQGAGRHHFGLAGRGDAGAQLHHRALAEAALDLAQGVIERALPVGVFGGFPVPGNVFVLGRIFFQEAQIGRRHPLSPSHRPLGAGQQRRVSKTASESPSRAIVRGLFLKSSSFFVPIISLTKRPIGAIKAAH